MGGALRRGGLRALALPLHGPAGGRADGLRTRGQPPDKELHAGVGGVSEVLCRCDGRAGPLSARTTATPGRSSQTASRWSSKDSGWTKATKARAGGTGPFHHGKVDQERGQEVAPSRRSVESWPRRAAVPVSMQSGTSPAASAARSKQQRLGRARKVRTKSSRGTTLVPDASSTMSRSSQRRGQGDAGDASGRIERTNVRRLGVERPLVQIQSPR